MPKRIVDGDALWRSKKLKNVRKEFRAEYANLIPLAEANGVFDADPDRVWADVYSFNRPDVDVKMVVRILDEFAKAEMLYRWDEKGKTWGYWNGIEGRLPKEAHLERYRNLPPDYPGLSGTKQDEAGQVLEGLGLVLDRSGIGKEQVAWSAPKSVNLRKVLPALSLKILHCRAERVDWWKSEIQELADAFGSGRVAEAFEAWASARQGEIVNKPVSEFLRVATGYLEGSFGQAQPEVDQLLARLYEAGGQTFAGKHKAAVVRLVNEYGIPDVEAAYREFITSKDDHDMKYAVRDFAEGGAVAIILAQRKRQADAAAVEAVMADNRKEMERLAEEEQAKVFEQEQLEADETVEAFDFGNS